MPDEYAASLGAPASPPATPQDSGEKVDLCIVCEKQPYGPDDEAMCVECREDFTDHCDTLTDPIEIVLGKHMRAPVSTSDMQLCMCLWSIEGGPAFHRRHVAAAIYAVLDDDGPKPWIIGPKSRSGPAMERAGLPPKAGGSDG